MVRVADIKFKETKIPQFDAFFHDTEDPLHELVGWNNKLYKLTTQIRGLGLQIKHLNQASVPIPQRLIVSTPELGVISVRVDGDVDKVTKTMVEGIEKKTKLVNKRFNQLSSNGKLGGGQFVISDDFLNGDPVTISGADRSTLENDSDFQDLERSLGKLNDKIQALDLHLKGPVTFSESVTACMVSIEEALKKHNQQLQIVVQNGLPKITIPTKLPAIPDVPKRAVEVIMELIDFVKALLSDVPDMQSKVADLCSRAQKLSSQVTNAAKEAKLNPLNMIKASKATGENVKALSQAPNILKTLLSTVKETGSELLAAMTTADTPQQPLPDSRTADGLRKASEMSVVATLHPKGEPGPSNQQHPEPQMQTASGQYPSRRATLELKQAPYLWRQHWFELKAGVLVYYQGVNRDKPITIPISGNWKVEKHQTRRHPYSFGLSEAGQDSPKFILAASDFKTQHDWLEDLSTTLKLLSDGVSSHPSEGDGLPLADQTGEQATQKDQGAKQEVVVEEQQQQPGSFLETPSPASRVNSANILDDSEDREDPVPQSKQDFEPLVSEKHSEFFSDPVPASNESRFWSVLRIVLWFVLVVAVSALVTSACDSEGDVWSSVESVLVGIHDGFDEQFVQVDYLDGGWGTGKLVGIVVGFVVLVILAVVWYRKRKERQHNEHQRLIDEGEVPVVDKYNCIKVWLCYGLSFLLVVAVTTVVVSAVDGGWLWGLVESAWQYFNDFCGRVVSDDLKPGEECALLGLGVVVSFAAVVKLVVVCRNSHKTPDKSKVSPVSN